MKHIGTSVFLSAENRKTIPVREQSKKLNPLSLLFCLPSAFHKDRWSAQALGFWHCAEDSGTVTKDTSSWQTSESGRFIPSFTGNQAANHQPPPFMANFPKLRSHREGPQEPTRYSYSEKTENRIWETDETMHNLEVWMGGKQCQNESNFGEEFL